MHDTHRATPLAGQQQTQANPGGSGDTFGGVINSRTLDIGRILGASTIFYFHIGLSGRYPLSSYGEYAVEYFVMLAGIAYILFSRSKPSVPSEYFDYMKKRLASLFPMFVIFFISALAETNRPPFDLVDLRVADAADGHADQDLAITRRRFRRLR